MTDFSIITEMPYINYVLSERENNIKETINKLKLPDVKEDSTFDRTKQKVKNDFKLEEATIGDPKIVDYESIEKNFGRSYENPFGGRRTVNIITISFPITGSEELFALKPMNFTFSLSSNLRVYQPTGTTVTIEIESFDLNKDNALIEAQKEIQLTRNVVENNNNVIKQWNSSAESMIESLANAKRVELLDFFK